MDPPPLLFNPLDGVMLTETIKNNDCITLKNILSSNRTVVFEEGLYTAAAWGRVECMKILLEHDADPNHTTKKGNTPLHYAKTVKTAQLLLDHDALVNVKNKKGRTPLYKALFCNKGQGLEIAQLLLEHGAHINCIDKKKKTLLHHAVKNTYHWTAEFLLHNGINPNITNGKGLTAFECVMDYYGSTYTKLFTVFKKYGMLFYRDVQPADIFSPAPYNMLTKANMFDADLCLYINRVAGLFVSANYYNEAYDSPKNGISFNRSGCLVQNISKSDLARYFTPITFKKISTSLRFLRKEMVFEFEFNNSQGLSDLLECFPWLTHYDNELTYRMIQDAIENGYNKCLQALLETKADLSGLITYDHRIDKECMLDVKSRGICAARLDKIPFLHWAVLCDNSKAIRLLIKYGADCLQKNNNQQTPLEYAIQLDRKKCIDVLNVLLCQFCRNSYEACEYKKSKQYMRSIIDPNVLLDKGDLLLHAVIKNSDIKKVMQFLPLILTKRADVNRANGKGKTALSKIPAYDENMFPIFEMLLVAGAKIVNRGNANNSLLTMAVAGESYKLIELFLEYGALVTKDAFGFCGRNTPKKIKQLLQQKYDEQACCVCYEHPDDLSDIACQNRHSEFLCKHCHGLCKPKCPMCQNVLGDFV
jgi:ankyrin repeat protein